jgi:hypothetical protein
MLEQAGERTAVARASAMPYRRCLGAALSPPGGDARWFDVSTNEAGPNPSPPVEPGEGHPWRRAGCCRASDDQGA